MPDLDEWEQIAELYRTRDFSPAWVSERGLTPVAASLLEAICGADRDGLEANLYQPETLRRAIETAYRTPPVRSDVLADLELRMTHAFLTLAHDRLVGFLLPAEVAPDWRIPLPKVDLPAVLRAAVREGRVDGPIEEALPFHPEHDLLRRALRVYRAIAAEGGWTAIPGDVPLRRGMIGLRVALLRQRLAVTGDLDGRGDLDAAAVGEVGMSTIGAAGASTNGAAGESTIGVAGASTNGAAGASTNGAAGRAVTAGGATAGADGSATGAVEKSPTGGARGAGLGGLEPAFARFDAGLESAVKRFQSRHGLVADGRVAGATLRALNVPVSERIRQIEVNLERWRWLPSDFPDRRIVVNIPEFTLHAFGDGREVLTMPVVVGEEYDDRATPVFSNALSIVEFSPYWNVPRSILEKELLPEIIRNPRYLERRHYEIVNGWQADAPVIDPATVDWKRVVPSRFPYRIRQRPGPDNALGRVKFLFPNPYSVYMHDTPEKEKFDRQARAFSHGCIRLSRPFDLARYVFEGMPGWDDARIRSMMAAEATRQVRIRASIPVYIVYLTVFVEDGRVQFRDDVYGADRRIAAMIDALEQTGEDPEPLCSMTR
jgi:murein L,D-transpeptidase YcbB/YkuD